MPCNWTTHSDNAAVCEDIIDDRIVISAQFCSRLQSSSALLLINLWYMLVIHIEDLSASTVEPPLRQHAVGENRILPRSELPKTTNTTTALFAYR